MLHGSPFQLLRAVLLAAGLHAAPTWAAPAVTPPRLVSEPRVELPDDAELGTRGRSVPTQLVIETDGSVSEVIITESQGEVLDAAARRAAFSLRFEPARADGQPVRTRIAFLLPLGRSEADRKPSPRSERTASPPRDARGTPSDAPVEIVVTGARIPERSDRSVVATQSISREDARQSGATTIAGVLEAQPGLQLQETFRGTELWIRGLDPEYTLVLIDGQRLPGRIGGAVDLSRYPLETMERIEVLRGPSSALYGSDAIGGVVNIVTRESERELEGDAEARIGTNDAVAGSARVAGRPLGWLGISASAGHQHTSAFRRNPDSLGTTGSERRLSTAGGTLTFGKDKHSRLRLSADYSQNRLTGVDEGAGRAVFDRTQLQEQFLTALNHTHDSGTLYLQNVAQYSQFREQYLVDQRGSVALDSYQDNREHLGQITTTVAQRWSATHRTTLGTELMTQVLDSERLTTTGRRVRYSAFAEHRWAAITTRTRDLLSLVPGARADIDSQFGSQLSPKLALRWDPLTVLTLRAGYGRGFRAPSFQELLLRFENPAVGYVVNGNPDLTAESSHSVDLSAEFRPDRTWFVSLAGFHNQLTDMIATMTAEAPTGVGTLFTYGNIESAWTRGLESMAVWSPAQLLALTFAYTLTETRDEALQRPLQGRPLHRFLVRAVSQYEPWGLTFSGRASLSLDRAFFVDADGDGQEDTVSIPPLAQVDLRLAKSFDENFELFVGVNNLADAGDAYTALLPRQIYAGLRGSY